MQEGRAAIQLLQSIAEQFEKGKLKIAATADVQVAGVDRKCHLYLHRLINSLEMSNSYAIEEIRHKL